MLREVRGEGEMIAEEMIVIGVSIVEEAVIGLVIAEDPETTGAEMIDAEAEVIAEVVLVR